MPIAKTVAARRLRLPSLPLPELFMLCALGSLVALGSLLFPPAAWAQSAPAKATSGTTSQAAASMPQAKASAPVLLLTKPTGQQWHELSAAQKQILKPLAATWNSLSSGHKSKWISLAASYPSHAPAEQEKMQSRMVEWAALTPVQRERARLNFAETKKVPQSQRAAQWEAYQSLSAQEKRLLAAKGKRKLTGAAIAVTPVPPEKITPVPVTRHTLPQESGTPVFKSRIDPYTLLPLPPVAPAMAPAAPVAPVPVARTSAPG